MRYIRCIIIIIIIVIIIIIIIIIIINIRVNLRVRVTIQVRIPVFQVLGREILLIKLEFYNGVIFLCHKASINCEQEIIK